MGTLRDVVQPRKQFLLFFLVGSLFGSAMAAEDEGCGSWGLYDKKVTVYEKESRCIRWNGSPGKKLTVTTTTRYFYRNDCGKHKISTVTKKSTGSCKAF